MFASPLSQGMIYVVRMGEKDDLLIQPWTQHHHELLLCKKPSWHSVFETLQGEELSKRKMELMSAGEQKPSNIENSVKYGHIDKHERFMPLEKDGRNPKWLLAMTSHLYIIYAE